MFSSDRYATNPEDVSKFCDTIREKPGWTFKLLDESKGLATKWAMEAQFLRNEEEINDDTLLVVQAIRDLKAEANRIVALDYAPRLLQTSIHALSASEGTPFPMIEQDVTNALKIARKCRYFFTQPKLRENVGVFVSDDLVPKSLQSELGRELDLIAREEPKDIHPGSGGKVQDLIHPSLYPYVADISPVHPGVTLPPLRDGKFQTTQSSLFIDHFESRFAWIPSIFRISEDGLDVHIDGYINGLGPRERYSNLYRLIEKAFLVVLPQLERTIEWEYTYETSDSEGRWMVRQRGRAGTTRDDWLALLDFQSRDKQNQKMKKEKGSQRKAGQRKYDLDHASEFYALDNSVAAVPDNYRNKQLKVIVKAANYVLQPGQEYDGTWHMEGMPHEQIVASAIYYYQADPEINDQGLSFRRRRDEDDFPSADDYEHEDFDIKFVDDQDNGGYEQDYPSDWEYIEYNGELRPRGTSQLQTFTELGTVQATGVLTGSGQPTARIITFPNWIQHKVAGISHSSTDSSAPTAVRKILCFFLVDGDRLSTCSTVSYRGFAISGLKDMHILSSSDVPSQARCCNIQTLHLLLLFAFRRSIGKEIPAELRNFIIDIVIEGTVTREQAEKWRRELMEDRKIKLDSRDDDGAYSLCEH